MSSIMEEDFKICGLCSQLVDESIVIKENLRTFLTEFLNISNDVLPSKTCLECYKVTIECLRFRDQCKKSINKLDKKPSYANMILGRSKEDSKVGTKSENTTPGKGPRGRPKSKANSSIESPAAPEVKKNKILESLGLDLPNIEITEGRASRSSRSQQNSATPPSTGLTRAAALGLRTKGSPSLPPKIEPKIEPKKEQSSTRRNARSSISKPAEENGGLTKKCKIVIKKVERDRAERHLKQHGFVPNPNDLNTGMTGVTSSRKRGAATDMIESSSPVVVPPPSKKLRKGYAYEAVPINQEPQPIKQASPPKSKSTPKSESRSSFGRVRNNTKKSGYVYDKEDITVIEEKSTSPPPPPPTAKTPQKATKATPKPASKKKPVEKKLTPVPDPEPVSEDDDDDDDDDVEEVFPTIGPYQCEICQVITDTKSEFVEHIEEKHKGIVDEDVLKSLKSDIRKSKKKLKNSTPQSTKPAPKKDTPKATANKDPPKAAAKKETPKPATKKTPAKPQTPAKATPPPKKVTPKPTPASKKNTPKPASKKATPKPASKKEVVEAAPSPKSPEKQSRQYLCEFCDVLIKSKSKSDIVRHQDTLKCKAAKKKKQLENSQFTDDPFAEVIEKDIETIGEYITKVIKSKL